MSDANHRFLSCLTLRLDKPKENCGRCLTIAKHTVNDYHATYDRRYTPPPRWAKPSGPSPGHACGGGDSIMSFYKHVGGRWGQSPNIWWPEDRAWCVATEIDSLDTYIGGSKACIERVLGHPDLEALPIGLGARVDASGDTINV